VIRNGVGTVHRTLFVIRLPNIPKNLSLRLNLISVSVRERQQGQGLALCLYFVLLIDPERAVGKTLSPPFGHGANLTSTLQRPGFPEPTLVSNPHAIPARNYRSLVPQNSEAHHCTLH